MQYLTSLNKNLHDAKSVDFDGLKLIQAHLLRCAIFKDSRSLTAATASGLSVHSFISGEVLMVSLEDTNVEMHREA
jgi:altronate dehydratase